MRELILYLVRSLVDDPEAVSISEDERGQRLHFRLAVAETDKGKVIGKGGRTARALRLLLGAAAAKQGVRADLEILDG